jgi:hypothetical protein
MDSMTMAKAPTRATRTAVKPDVPPPPRELAFAIPVPKWLQSSEINLTDKTLLGADLKQALESQLGCLFALKDGEVRTADGRRMELRLSEDNTVLEEME